MINRRFFGLEGVHSDETPAAVSWGHFFEWPMIGIALWIPLQAALENDRLLTPALTLAANWVIWLVFFLETSVLLILVKQRKRYLAGNWMNLLIISLGFPLFPGHALLIGTLRILRIFLVFGVFFHVVSAIQGLLARNRLGPTLVVSAFFILFSGITISVLDPGITTPLDGIWWAWVTVTTVGYGDLVPTSNVGRLFGGILILLGVALFALLTANVSSMLNRADVEEMEQEENKILKQLKITHERLDRIEKKIQALADKQKH